MIRTNSSRFTLLESFQQHCLLFIVFGFCWGDGGRGDGGRGDGGGVSVFSCCVASFSTRRVIRQLCQSLPSATVTFHRAAAYREFVTDVDGCWSC